VLCPEKIMINLKSIDVSEQCLNLVWDDDVQGQVKAYDLRTHCPCASCVSEVTGEKILNDDHVPQDIKITGAEPMGTYAVSLGFSDRHSTGIFTYQQLRQMIS
jgi:DUF971 family protein